MITRLGQRQEEKSRIRYNIVHKQEYTREPIVLEDQPVNLLVMGLDGEETRSDVILLLNYSPKFSKLNILSIARDTRVMDGEESMKINAVYGKGGEKAVARKVEEMTGLYLDYYVVLNFEGFRKLIDTLGGVEFNVPMNMNYDDTEQKLHIHLKKGLQVLDGAKAEQLVRYRKGNREGEGYSEGDIGRIQVQQDFLKALVEQKMKMRYLSKAVDIYLILREYMRTNIEIWDIRQYLSEMKGVGKEGVKAYTLPGEARYIGDVWYFQYSPKELKDIIESSFYK